MTRYWVFSGSPVGKSTTSLADARAKAIRYIQNTGHDYYTVVSSDSEPYDWLGNYKVIGFVERTDGGYRWLPKSKDKDCRMIDSKGNLKERIARPRYW